MKIRVNVTVFWDGDGFRARADEFGMISACFRRQHSAVRNLKDRVTDWMRAEAAEGMLRKKLEAAGYLWPIGEDYIHVNLSEQLRVTLPLPRDRRTPSKSLNRRRAAERSA